MKERRIRIFPVGETEPELRKATQWFHLEFGRTGFSWAAPDYYALSEVDDELIGRLGIFDREVEVGAQEFALAGLVG